MKIIVAALLCSLSLATSSEARWHHRSPTPRPSPSRTPTPTATIKPSPSPTFTPTPTPSATCTPTPTPTPSSTFTPTPTPSATYTPTPTPTLAPTPTATVSNLSVPLGLACLLGGNTQTIPSSLTSNPEIQVYVVGDKWANIQPNPPPAPLNLARIDSLLSQVPAHSLVRFAIGQSASEAPTWAVNAVPANEKITYLDTNPYHGCTPTPCPVTIPVDWSPTWLNEKVAIVQMLGAHYTNNPKIAVIEWCAVTGAHNDWSIPSGNNVDGLPPAGSTVNSRMRDAGYTHDAILGALKTMCDANAAYWPNQVLTTPSGPITGGLETEPLSVIKELMTYAQAKYGAKRIVIANYGINAHMPVPPPATSDLALYGIYKPNTAGQAVWNCSGDATCRVWGSVPCDKITAFKQMIDQYIAIGGVGYFEAYQSDLVDPEMKPAIDYAYQQLNPTLGMKIIRYLKSFF